jgi:serine/threonine protein kinase
MGRLSLAQLAGVFEGVLAGLAHAAKRRIIHRDLKPENLMVSGEGTIKIADFGIAKALNQATVGRLLTATGTTVGTPTYMSPEQAMGRDLGPWTDLYSVGVMAYEMLVGQVPFHDAETPMAILMRHVNEPIPAPRSLRPDLDPELAGWIERLLAKAPADRTQSAHQAWDELEEIVLGVLGPRWRREARLLEPELPGTVTEEQPLTPAPFDAESDDGFETFQAAKPRSVPTPPEPAPSPPPTPTPAPENVLVESDASEPEPPPTPVPRAADTLPPEHRPPPATSFQWPTAERRARKLVWIGLAAAVAVASMLLGVLGALALRGSGGDSQVPLTSTVTTATETTTTTPSQGHRPRPPRTTARRTTLSQSDTAVVATIHFTGRRLGSHALATRDGDLTDGNGTVLIAQRGLKSWIGRNELGGLSLRPRDGVSSLTIVLSADRGAFTTVEARPDRTGKSVAIIATKKPKPKPPVTMTGEGSDGTTDSTGDGSTGGNQDNGAGQTGGGGGQRPCKPFLHKIGKC